MASLEVTDVKASSPNSAADMWRMSLEVIGVTQFTAPAWGFVIGVGRLVGRGNWPVAVERPEMKPHA